MDINTLDVTISGYPDNEFRLPNGQYEFFHCNGCSCFWNPYREPITKTLNLVNIEWFEPFNYPLVEIYCKEKPVSWFKKFWYSGWQNDKLYDIDIKVVGEKTVTRVIMRSKTSFFIDESVECLKNAIDACVWNADIKERIEN